MKHNILQRIKRVFVRPVLANITYSKLNGILDNKCIIITGGSDGIGKAIAKKCVELGAKVLITGRNYDKLEKTACELGCKFIQWDVTNTNLIEEKFQKCIQELSGKVDCLVNNAGIYMDLDYWNTDEMRFDSIINTNLKAPVFLSNYYVRYLLNNNMSGNILFISSETASCAYTNPYGISKAGLNSYIKGLAYEVSRMGIRSNAIAPGPTVSNINPKDITGDIGSRTIMGRFLLPEEIAETAVFLLSDISRSINGEIITVNGGNAIPVEYTRRKA